MKLPKLRTLSTSRQMVDTFQGYNCNQRIGDGEFSDMRNMTSDLYPVLAPRKQRGVYPTQGAPTAMIAKDCLCYVDGSNFVIHNYPVNMDLSSEPKQLISMGAYVIILPDKKWINTAHWDGTTFEEEDGWGEIEARFDNEESGNDVVFSLCDGDGNDYQNIADIALDKPPDPENTQLWIDTSSTPHVLKQYSEESAVWIPIATTYIKISCPGIGAGFAQYDGITISGIQKKALQALNGAAVVWKKDDDSLVVRGILDAVTTQTANEGVICIERKMPVMDLVIESGNRLWGCRYGTAANGQMVNELYCSKLGDFKNWNCQMGISTDSWVGGCGTDGPFTGAITHMGYPLFFKENYLHKVYGSFPSNFQIQTTACRGVQKDCEKSLAIVNEVLFYKAGSGICAYDGSLPTEVSYALGGQRYTNAAGGAHGNKYYVSMLDSAQKSHLFVYDTAKGLWHREDDLQVDAFCACRDELYALCDGRIVTLFGSGTKDTAPVQWMVQTGDLGLSSPDTKYISRLTLRMAMDIGTQVRISVQYDFSPAWESLGCITGDSLRSFSLPIRPKRCDHMRLRIEGEGAARLYSLTKTVEQGSDIS